MPVGGLPALLAHADPALAGNLLPLASAASARRTVRKAVGSPVRSPQAALAEREDVYMGDGDGVCGAGE